MRKSKICLPDANVLLAFAVERHLHHDQAMAWAAGLRSGEAILCRVTQMGFLRLLTKRKVMGDDTLTQVEAWRVFETILRDGRFRFADEPAGLEAAWKEQCQSPLPVVNLWTDSYLLAFAARSGAHMATLDHAAAAQGAVLI